MIRKLTLIIGLLALMLSATSCGVNKIADLGTMKGVNTVYLSKPMLSLAKKGSSLILEGTDIDVGSIANDINSVEVISTQTPKAASKANKIVENELKKMPRQNFIMDMWGATKNTRISVYGTPAGAGTLSDATLVLTSPQKVSIVIITGNISTERLQRLLK